jgi:hypothetical protein
VRLRLAVGRSGTALERCRCGTLPTVNAEAEVIVRLPLALDEARAFLGSASATARMTVVFTPATEVRIAPKWAFGRAYLERPTFVGALSEHGDGSVLSGRVVWHGRWFARVYFGGVAIAVVVALVTWLTAATGLRSPHKGSGGATLLLTPLILVAVGITIVRYSRFDGKRQADELLGFLSSLAPT